MIEITKYHFLILQHNGMWQVVPPTMPAMPRDKWLELLHKISRAPRQTPQHINAIVQNAYPDSKIEIKHANER